MGYTTKNKCECGAVVSRSQSKNHINGSRHQAWMYRKQQAMQKLDEEQATISAAAEEPASYPVELPDFDQVTTDIGQAYRGFVLMGMVSDAYDAADPRYRKTALTIIRNEIDRDIQELSI